MVEEELEGVFDVLFVGAPHPRRIEFVLVMRKNNGDPAYLMTEDETMYFPYTIISMKKVSNG